MKSISNAVYESGLVGCECASFHKPQVQKRLPSSLGTGLSSLSRMWKHLACTQAVVFEPCGIRSSKIRSQWNWIYIKTESKREGERAGKVKLEFICAQSLLRISECTSFALQPQLHLLHFPQATYILKFGW